MQNKTAIQAVGMQKGDTGRIYTSKLWQDNTHEYRCVKIKDIDQNFDLRKYILTKKKLEPSDLQELGLSSKWKFLYAFGQDQEFVVSRAKA